MVGVCLIRLEQIRPSGLPGFLGISSENAHRAMTDVYQTSWCIIKFQRLYRELTSKIKFKGAAKGVDFSKPDTWF